MKNEVYYKQRQRAVSGHLAAVSSVQTTPFWIFVSWLLPSGHWVFGFQQHPTPFVVPHFPPVACRRAPPHPQCAIAPPAVCFFSSSSLSSYSSSAFLSNLNSSLCTPSLLSPSGGALQSSQVHSEFTSISKCKSFLFLYVISYIFSLHSQSQQLLHFEDKNVFFFTFALLCHMTHA